MWFVSVGLLQEMSVCIWSVNAKINQCIINVSLYMDCNMNKKGKWQPCI